MACFNVAKNSANTLLSFSATTNIYQISVPAKAATTTWAGRIELFSVTARVLGRVSYRVLEYFAW